MKRRFIPAEPARAISVMNPWAWRIVAGQLVTSAIIGHVTLADVRGRPGAWRWVLTDPRQLTEPVTGVRGHPGPWLIDLPPRLAAGRNAPMRIRPSRPVAGRDP